MDILNPRSLKTAAKQQLSKARCSYKQLALIYMGVSVAAAVVVTLLQYFLDNRIDNTGGLSDMDTRVILSTIQLVLQYAVNILLPFWQMGFLLIALQLYRRQDPQPAGLLEGFRRFGPVLRLYLVETLMLMGAVLASIYAASILFSMTPFALPMMEKMLPLVESGNSLVEIQEAILSLPVQELWDMMKPMALLVVLIVPFPICVLYLRFRMAPYVIMDSDDPGALMALKTSRRITRHHRMKLLRLDLSFWWYYLLMGLATAVMYADIPLHYLSVALPISNQVLRLLCYLAGSLLQLLIFWQLGGYFQTTQAAAYETLKVNYKEPVKPQPKPVPQYPPYNNYPR